MAISSASSSEPNGEVHSAKSLTIPSVFAAVGVTNDLALGLRLPYMRRDAMISAHDSGSKLHNQENPRMDLVVFFSLANTVFRSKDNLNYLSVAVDIKISIGVKHLYDVDGELIETHSQPSAGS